MLSGIEKVDDMFIETGAAFAVLWLLESRVAAESVDLLPCAG
jgi:hypothetical protein